MKRLIPIWFDIDGTLLHTRADGWVIGDTPRDVAAAKTIGARCLGVASGAYTQNT